jgi:uncharacterized protein (TIGR03437 family)
VTAQVDYPEVGDLNVYLFSPQGTRARLLERNCGSLHNIDTSFDDAATTKYADFCPSEAGRGPFQSNEPLSNFVGQSSHGTWRLAVENNGSDSRIGYVVGFSVTVTGTVQQGPAIAAAGIRNSAWPIIGPLTAPLPIAPGELISVLGYNLGPQDGVTTGEDNWPTVMAGTSLRINGLDAPLRYVSFRRVDAQVPTGLDLTKNAKLSVVRNGVLSSEVEIPVASTSPAMFTVNLAGVGQAQAVNGDGTANASTPAAPGSLVTVFANGLGLTNPLAVDGQPIPPGVPLNTIAPVTATVGGLEARVLRAILTPGTFTHYAVVIEVPRTIKSGAAEVIIRCGASYSQSGVTIRVQ